MDRVAFTREQHERGYDVTAADAFRHVPKRARYIAQRVSYRFRVNPLGLTHTRDEMRFLRCNFPFCLAFSLRRVFSEGRRDTWRATRAISRNIAPSSLHFASRVRALSTNARTNYRDKWDVISPDNYHARNAMRILSSYIDGV